MKNTKQDKKVSTAKMNENNVIDDKTSTQPSDVKTEKVEIDPIAMLVPHFKANNRIISERLGFKAQSLLLPPDQDLKPDENGKIPVSNIQKEVWVLRDAQDYIWYHGQRVIAQDESLIQIVPASTENEVWERDNADYYHDLSFTFVLLKELPGHSLRIIDQNGDSIWELSYRYNVNSPTILQTHRFLTLLITDTFLKYTTLRIQEMNQLNKVE